MFHKLPTTRTWRNAWRWIWAAMVIVVGLAALAPGELAPSVSPNDKLDHTFSFAALAMAGLLAEVRPGWRGAATVAMSMVAYGGLIELAQTHIPGRQGDWADLAADIVGVALGLAVAAGLRRWRRSTAR